MNDKMQVLSTQCDWKVIFCTSQMFFWEANEISLILFTFFFKTMRHWSYFIGSVALSKVFVPSTFASYSIIFRSLSVVFETPVLYESKKLSQREKSKCISLHSSFGKGWHCRQRYVFPEICLPHLTIY